jgi:hypothetical protein
MSENEPQGHSELTIRQRKFIAAMLANRTVAAAADSLGVSKRSCQKWLTLPQVQQALSMALDELLDATTREVAWCMRDALEVLHSIALDPDAPYGSRVSAARAILSNGLALREAVSMSSRLREIEQAVGVVVE